ncbi:MAG: hypothetical protein K2Z81_11555, partial [Cyanobacteria bacterium]|nr:hypothetical protein [Cyanobacteriota bacterium]
APQGAADGLRGGGATAVGRAAAHGAAEGALIGGGEAAGRATVQGMAEQLIGGGAAAVGRAAAQGAAESANRGGVANTGRRVGEAILEGINSGAGAAAGRALRSAVEGALEGGGRQSGRTLGDAIQGSLERALNGTPADRFEHLRNADRAAMDFQFSVTDADRTRAKDVLSRELSELIPEADRNMMRRFQSAIIDGNMEALTATLRQLNQDPARLDLFIRALNRQLDGHEGLNGIDIMRDSAGNVLIYDQNRGNVALQINPRSGEAAVRAIEIQRDGSVLLRPGEIINRQPADVLRAVSDEATRSVVGPRIQNLRMCPVPAEVPPIENRRIQEEGTLRRILQGN